MTSGSKFLNKGMLHYLRRNEENELDSREPLSKLKEKKLLKSEIQTGGYLTLLYNVNSTHSNHKKKELHSIAINWNNQLNKHKQSIPRLGVGVRRFIFSPCPKKMNSFPKKTKERILENLVRKTMKQFRDRYFSGDQIGYVFSIHKDKPHIHAHVYLHTITKNGRYVSMNAPKYKSKNGKLIVVNSKTTTDKLSELKKIAEKSFQKYYDKELKKIDKNGVLNKISLKTNKNVQYKPFLESRAPLSRGARLSKKGLGKKLRELIEKNKIENLSLSQKSTKEVNEVNQEIF